MDAGEAADWEGGGNVLTGSDDRSGTSGASADAIAASRHAAAAALALGEAPGSDGRFRESEFYIRPVR